MTHLTLNIWSLLLWAVAAVAGGAALPAISWTEVGAHNEQRVRVSGTVAFGYVVDGVCYLRFDMGPRSPAVVIDKAATGREKAPVPLYNAFVGRKITVTGVVRVNPETERPELAVHSLVQFAAAGDDETDDSPTKAQPRKATVADARVTASTTQMEWEGEGPAADVLDGDLTTRWSSSYQDGQQLIIDLGRVEPVAGLNVYWETASAKVYNVAVSRDGGDWQTVSEQVDGARGPRTDELRFEPRSGRLIRLDLIRRATEYGFSIYDIDVLTRP